VIEIEDDERYRSLFRACRLAVAVATVVAAILTRKLMLDRKPRSTERAFKRGLSLSPFVISVIGGEGGG